jgi:hypothetical protein
VTKFAYRVLFVYFTLTTHDSDVMFTMVVMGAIITIVHDDDDDDSDIYPVF